MKLNTRLMVAFAAIIIMPILLSVLVAIGFAQYQLQEIEETYGITGTSYETLSNPISALSTLTLESYAQLQEIGENTPDLLLDQEYADSFNEGLMNKNSYLIVRKDGVIVYIGDADAYATIEETGLPKHGYAEYEPEMGNYYGGDEQVLIKQLDFTFSDGMQGTAFIITDVSHGLPEVEEYLSSVIGAVIIILIFTGMALVFWIQRGVLKPLGKMRVAAQNIMDGNLEFEVIAETDDELGQLCRDFEEMRIRLKTNAEEKLAYDRASKELISNITHDLKTPITAIKGYAEGIIDGVADTQEKRDKYIKTIYNKANELNILINELTVYSKVDRSRIPYNFQNIPVGVYFDDCAEDLLLELESKNIGFEYHNFVTNDIKIIADPEQIGRVIHNIVNNSVKYMDKEIQHICLRIKDVGDFVQVELEDNGKGIMTKDLPFIFDRFYRTDASRNSSTGGSGIGLSIVKRIMEEHGGKIWATSRDGVGTVIYFVIRKYREAE